MTDFEDSETAHPTEALSFNGSRILDPDFAANPSPASPLDPLRLIDLSVDELHRKVADEVTMLDMLSREGQLRIRTRLLILFAEMAKRFDDGLSYEGRTGKRAMATYLRSVGCDPGKLRVWRFLLRKEETAALAGKILVPTAMSLVEVGDADDPTIVNQDVAGKDLIPEDAALSSPITFRVGEDYDLPAAESR